MKRKSRLPFSGGVAICKKQSDGKQVTVWVEKAPELKARAGSLKAAEEALVNLLWERFDLDEPIAFQYRDEPEEAACSDPERYFEQGFCPICQSGRGQRSQQRLDVVWLPSKAISGVTVQPQPRIKCGRAIHMELLHMSLCGELTKASKADFEFRNVAVNGKFVSNYVEVIPRSVFPQVVPKSQKGYLGWKCHECGNTAVNFEGGFAAITQRDADVVRKQGAAALGSISRPLIVVTGALFKRLQKNQAGKGLLAFPVIEFPEDQIAVRPRLTKAVPFKL
jgi:hypothetical protein